MTDNTEPKDTPKVPGASNVEPEKNVPGTSNPDTAKGGGEKPSTASKEHVKPPYRKISQDQILDPEEKAYLEWQASLSHGQEQLINQFATTPSGMSLTVRHEGWNYHFEDKRQAINGVMVDSPTAAWYRAIGYVEKEPPPPSVLNKSSVIFDPEHQFCFAKPTKAVNEMNDKMISHMKALGNGQGLQMSTKNGSESTMFNSGEDVTTYTELLDRLNTSTTETTPIPQDVLDALNGVS